MRPRRQQNNLPKVVVEVISPSTQKVDEEIKPLIYAWERVDFLVLVYPKRERLICLTLKGEKYESFPCSKRLEIPLKGNCQIEIDPKEVWERI